jgi:alpha-L-fucosidase
MPSFKKIHAITVCLSALLATSLTACAAMPEIKTTPTPPAVRAKEMSDMKWGMFICWSFSTFSGREWTREPHGPEFFKATGNDTDQWCQTAKEAGMGYILFLTKHHDGFCLWDTKTTDLKVTNSPLKKDVVAELRKSCDKYGIRLAIYFSEGDWPMDRKKATAIEQAEFKKAQLKELLTQYGPIEYIWFDHAAGTGGLGHADTVKWCKQFQPNCLIGFNHGEKAGDIQLGEHGKPGPVGKKTGVGADSGDSTYANYLVAEFTYPILPKGGTRCGGADWFYSLPQHDDKCLPADKLYQDYLGAVKYGNIFSIDIGPNYAGKIRDIDVKTLREVGKMIRGEK